MTVQKGRTQCGKEFDVPYTPDMLETLMAPHRWGPLEFMAAVQVLVALIGACFVRSLSLWVYIATFAFWRFSYNLGIGLILHAQGTRSVLTRRISKVSPKTDAILKSISTHSLPVRHDWSSAPHELNAWLVFRAIGNVVLAADGMSYVALCAACFNFPTTQQLPTFLLCLPIGLGLIVFSVWAKKCAHDALGDYAWFWGDFFFKRVGATLIEDGVFALAPHPMYTLGYTAYYGSAIITRSYTLLAISLIAHAMQMAFLYLVEEPHMRRIYGRSNENDVNVEKVEIVHPLKRE